MNKTFVLGDVHGGYLALLQVIEKSCIDKENDTLIMIGDIVDGWPDTFECVEELLTFKNLIAIAGNHDEWARNYLKFEVALPIWLTQGGYATVESYKGRGIISRLKHLRNYFDQMVPYHIDENNNAYVHGGYTCTAGLGHDDYQSYIWDRSLWNKAKSANPGHGHLNMTSMYNRLFIGHTSLGNSKPLKRCNVWNIDTGGGWEGKLTIMDVVTEEFWQSDVVKDLYPNVKGR